jgi:hypothetical protein
MATHAQTLTTRADEAHMEVQARTSRLLLEGASEYARLRQTTQAIALGRIVRHALLMGGYPVAQPGSK